MGDALWMNLLMRYFSTKPSPGSSKKSGGGNVMAGVLTTLASTDSIQNDGGVSLCGKFKLKKK